jgi:ketosteroid isomerase-like protein
MSSPMPDVIARYFAAQSSRDTDSLIALFRPDAVVFDENQTWRGTSEIRAWRDGVATAFQYTTEVLGLQSERDGDHIARVRLEGNFPGGIVELKYHFVVELGQIQRLEIGPD